MPPTLADIAAATGFSTATVSRSLRGDKAVTAKTRSRVLRACSELGYRPSVGGRILAQGSLAFVGLSLGQTDNSTTRYVSLLHQALSQRLSATGWALRLVSSDNFVQNLSDVGAMIIIGTVNNDPRIKLCTKHGIAHVAIGYDRFNTGFSLVPDDAGGARLVARHFADTGRKRMAVMASRRSGEGHDILVRANACMDEGRRLGLEPVMLPAVNGITSTLDGYRSIMALGGGISFDCLFCETDEQALGARAALMDMGKKVPGEIAVAGFDDLPDLSSSLTTVRQDFSLLAKTALELLDRARRGEEPSRVVLPVRLIVRDSG